MTSEKNSFERLHDAGVIDGNHFSEADKQILEKITGEEVEVLIRLRKKMGAAPADKPHLRPNMGV